MNNSGYILRDAILMQKREWEERRKELYVVREHARINRDGGLIQVVVGPRRAGKSFFALHAMAGQPSCGYANFDDERLSCVENYDDILAGIDEVYGQPSHLVLDEIQNLPRWELFVNRLQRQGRRLVITGSNSNLLSSELSTHLTGRHRLISILPFSFSEYLRLGEGTPTTSETAARLSTYVRVGGFPEPLVHSIDRTEYLRTLLGSILYKDIVKRYRIRAVQGLEDMAHYLFSNIAKEFSFQALTRITRCRSVATAEKYLRYLEETFLFFTIKRFSFKVREQVAYNKKVYSVDNGLALAGGFRHSPDTGRLYENLVAVALWRRTLTGDAKVYFWKNSEQEEVDFVVKKGLQIESLIQVCQSVEPSKTFDREVRALIKAGGELKCRKLIVLTEDREATETVEWYGAKARIQFLPLWKWLKAEAHKI